MALDLPFTLFLTGVFGSYCAVMGMFGLVSSFNVDKGLGTSSILLKSSCCIRLVVILVRRNVVTCTSVCCFVDDCCGHPSRGLRSWMQTLADIWRNRQSVFHLRSQLQL